MAAAQQATESEREARKEVEAKMEQAQQDAEATIDQLKAQNEVRVRAGGFRVWNTRATEGAQCSSLNKLS